MRYGLSFLTALAWGVWVVGLMTLFLTVSRLFAVNHANAVVAAPQMFIVFERYQLALAAASLIGSAFWRLREPRAILSVIFSLFAVASIATVVQTTLISAKMHHLREMGESSGPEFMRLHGISMAVYMSEATVLLVAGFLLVGAIGSRARGKTVATSEAPACA